MVRSGLALVRLLNPVSREDRGAAERRSEQRASGQTIWSIQDELVADDLRDVLGSERPTVPEADLLSDYDRPEPMDGPPDEEVTERLTILRVG